MFIVNINDNWVAFEATMSIAGNYGQVDTATTIQSTRLTFRHNYGHYQISAPSASRGMGSALQYHRQKHRRRGFFGQLTLDKIPEYHLAQGMETPSPRRRQVMMEGPLGTPAKWIQHQGPPQSCPGPCPLGPGAGVVQTPNTCLGMSLLE